MATAGNDVLYTSADWEVLDALAGNDRVTSYHNGTTLYGGSGSDWLYTTLNYGVGYLSDLYAFQYGGSGGDRLRIDLSAYSNYIGVVADGGDGSDVIEIVSLLTSPSALFPTLIENYGLGGAGNDLIRVTGSIQGGTGRVVNEAYGGAGFDVIFMDASASGGTGPSHLSNYAEGNASNDVIEARITGSQGNGDTAYNELIGGLGHDILSAWIFNDGESFNGLYGGDGYDRLEAHYEGHGASTSIYSELYGEAGNDTLLAQSHLRTTDPLGETTANHELFGGFGLDQLTSKIEASGGTFDLEAYLFGEEGDDIIDATIKVDAPVMNDATFINYLDGGAASDRLTATIDVTIGDADGMIYALNWLSGGNRSDLLEATLKVNVTGTSAFTDYAVGTNELYGGAGADTLIGRVETSSTSALVNVTGRSLLYGNAGSDTLIVYGGMDNLLDGGAEADFLTGGDGEDRLIGGAGNDEMTGNGAKDTFVFGLDSGNDIITDFELGVDTFEMVGGQSVSMLSAMGPADTLVTFTDGSTVLLQQVMVTDAGLLFV